MSMLSFIKTNKLTVSFWIVVIAAINFILITSSNLNKSLMDILYLDFLIDVFSFIYILIAYSNWKSRYKILMQALDNNKKVNAMMIEGEDFYSSLIMDIIQNKNLEAELQEKELKNSLDELNDYITKWVHEIKLPVSVCELILERIEDNTLVNEIQTELERIKFLTNQVLYIGRASSYSEDLAVRNIELSKVIKKSIKRNSNLLISKNIEIIVSNLDFTVLSDEKWISYILDQILNNSYKYLNQNGTIKIDAGLDANNNVELRIWDNGVGIMPKDISRIFDKSFTGNNKSDLSKSTGMGLYITKKMLDKLGHKIEVQSKPNYFTEFIITFYRTSDYRIQIT